MQPRPSAAEILATVAEVLEQQVVPALKGQVQHNARVAASLVAIVEREIRLAPAADRAEADALAALLAAAPDGGTSGSDGTGGIGDVAALRARFAAALRAGMADDDDDARRVWPVLMDGVRADLAVVKPGHDSWSGD